MPNGLKYLAPVTKDITILHMYHAITDGENYMAGQVFVEYQHAGGLMFNHTIKEFKVLLQQLLSNPGVWLNYESWGGVGWGIHNGPYEGVHFQVPGELWIVDPGGGGGVIHNSCTAS